LNYGGLEKATYISICGYKQLHCQKMKGTHWNEKRRGEAEGRREKNISRQYA